MPRSVSFASPSATASEAAHERLRSRAPAEVLLPLPRRLTDALLLLLDIGHLGKRPAARGPGDGSNPAPYAALVEDAERQRQERRLERDRRRREQGKPTYFESDATLDSWPVAQDPAERSTAIIRPRRDPDRDELIELEAQALDQEGQAAQAAAFAPTVTPERPEPEADVGRGLARSGVIFAIATGISRVIGLVREIAQAAIFGISGPINAFEIAFLIPNTVRSLVADSALSAAFVPVFSDLLVKGERKRAWRVASSIFWLMLLGLGGITALFIVIAPWVMQIFGYGPDNFGTVATALARILFPIVVVLGLTGIVVGILNSYDHFTVPALSPVLWNLIILLGLGLGVQSSSSDSTKLYIYAAAILVATIAQFPAAAMAARARWQLQRGDHIRDPAVKRVFVLMVPVTIGLGLININALIDQLFATHYLDEHRAPAAIVRAWLTCCRRACSRSRWRPSSSAPLATRRARTGAVPAYRRHRAAADLLPARAGERRRSGHNDSDRAAPTSIGTSPATRRSWLPASPHSRSGSRSTGRC